MSSILGWAAILECARIVSVRLAKRKLDVIKRPQGLKRNVSAFYMLSFYRDLTSFLIKLASGTEELLQSEVANRMFSVPAAPVNVSVTQLRAHSAMVTWNVPQGDAVNGYAILQQRQDGLMQRSIREVNTSSRWCVLWDLDEDTHYSVQVRHTHSQEAAAVLTLNASALFVSYEPAMEGLGMSPHLQTGELLIVTTVLLLWAAVIALFCRQYDIIKDSDSNSTKEKAKRPLAHNANRPPATYQDDYWWDFV
uniref:Fibronectin type-III domain-containing protein n=1 Tax=Mola mola TaxID=94237 RepID=A0A3Q4A9S1_MOLML